MADIEADERKPREADSREAGERVKSWEPPQVLPDPAPQDGWVFRWIRTSIMGNQDNVNASKRFREGWEPVRAEDHPEMMLTPDRGSEYAGNIEVGGLLLCKTSEENFKQRSDYYSDLARRQNESVNNNFMRDGDPRMPKLNESSTRVTFGGGAKPS
jgi:hypothetical protein